MWKSVENFSGSRADQAAATPPLQSAFRELLSAGTSPQPLSACSACAGDYEDPDRTAWTVETEEGEARSEERAQGGLQERAYQAAEDAACDEDEDHDEFPAKEA
jgi:hypothetical protein